MFMTVWDLVQQLALSLEGLEFQFHSMIGIVSHSNHCQMVYQKLFSCGEGRKEMFYLMTHSTHFIYCYMASDIW